MMLKRFLLLLAVAAMLGACNSSPAASEEAAAEETKQDAATAAKDGRHFGEVITADNAISYDELLLQMQGQDSLQVKVTGTVAAVCQAKGCWMNLSPAAEGPELFVQFKDYGFFMPKDIAGRSVVMDGYAYREITSVEDLRHFAEDAGKSEEEIQAITEPQEELKFLASGVILLDENE